MTVLWKSVKPARTLVAACVLAAAASGLVLSGAPASVRLVGVTAQAAGKNTALLIEASEPVAYAVSRPDPLTLYVDMRNVAAADATAQAAQVARTGAVAGVTVEDDTALDGKALARVKVALTTPASYTVHSSRNTIRLELEPAAGALPIDETTAVRPANRAETAAADTATVPAATSLQKVHASHTRTSTTITLSGNGRLDPSNLTESEDGPRRLMLDFPSMASAAPAQTGVDGIFVKKVHVTASGRDPQGTRVVFDISPTATYHVQRSGNGGRDLALVFEGPRPGGSVMVAPPSSRESKATAADDDTMTMTEAMAHVAAITPGDPMAALETPAAKAPDASKTAAKPAAPAPRPAMVAAPAQQGTLVSAQQPQPQQPQPPVTTPAPAGQAQPTLSQTVPGTAQKQYTGAPISMDFEDSDLRSVLRVFSETSGLNIIIDPSVQGRVNMVLNEVPWDQAMETILRANKLGYTVEGNIVRIAPLAVLADEQADQAKLADAKALAGELRVQTFALSYAKADILSPLLTKSALSRRGQIQTDPRTNTLIVTDLPDRLQTAASLIATLDRPEPQVEVEARIVQTTRDFAKTIGVQWGFNGRADSTIGNTTSLAFPNNGTIGGQAPAPTGQTVPAGTAVSLGAPGATSAVGLALGALNGAFNVDLALSALESSGKGRVLSTPRLTTQNNQEAEVAQGIQIPIQTTANNTISVQFKDAVLSLKVTPQITAANTVIMQISVENATPDFARQVQGIPPVNTQRALTRVQVSDGMTTVIGGIFTSQETTTNDRTPVLHRVPLLGWLFRRDAITDSSRELLIFITPRILRG